MLYKNATEWTPSGQSTNMDPTGVGSGENPKQSSPSETLQLAITQGEDGASSTGSFSKFLINRGPFDEQAEVRVEIDSAEEDNLLTAEEM